jgi:thiol-disulfide isomerase/thioredoxin
MRRIIPKALRRGVAGAALLALAAAFASSQERPASPATSVETSELEFGVAGMTCPVCAQSAIKALEKLPGVRGAQVDFDSAQALVRSDRTIPPSQVREALGDLGLEARFPGDVEPPPLSDEELARLDVRTASQGEAIRIQDHLAPGRVTIFDYFADWCGPCHLLTPKLHRLALKYAEVAIRKVDISSWDSDAARQATRDFRLPGVPYVRIYDPAGKLLGEIHGNHIDRVEALVVKGLKR